MMLGRVGLTIFGILVLAVVSGVQAQTVSVYEPVPGDKITATASSSFAEFDVINMINGAGLKNHRHQSHNLGRTMWISQVSKTPVRAHRNTREGVVWLMYAFEKPQSLDLLEIWNHNQHNHLNRGLRKVYLEYSLDGVHWSTL